jgi:orotate phosphoribosyltransferase
MHGKLVLRRGFKIKENSNVLIVEDVITTGKSALECASIIKTNNANLVGYACIIDRSNENIAIKDKIVCQLQFNLETFSEDKLPEDLKKIQPIKPGSRNLS